METTEKAIEVLNDLIEINNDRVAGFEKASNDLEGDDQDLKAIFEQFAQDSRRYSAELSSAVQQNGGEATTGTSGTGTLHRAWIDVKATFSGHGRKAILAECERGEDAIKMAYHSALDPDNELSPELAQLINTQKQGVDAGHHKIKALRDIQS